MLSLSLDKIGANQVSFKIEMIPLYIEQTSWRCWPGGPVFLRRRLEDTNSIKGAWHSCRKSTHPWPPGTVPQGFTRFAGPSLLHGAWDAPFGECRRSQVYLLFLFMGFHQSEAPTIKRPCAIFQHGGISDKYSGFLATLSRNITLLTHPCTSCKINPFHCKLRFEFLFQ